MKVLNGIVAVVCALSSFQALASTGEKRFTSQMNMAGVQCNAVAAQKNASTATNAPVVSTVKSSAARAR